MHPLTENDQAQDFGHLRALVDTRLGELVPSGAAGPVRLNEAMRHSLLAPGKRVRALIVLLGEQHWGGAGAAALDPACAVEMVHAASLILDDLPAMDDSSFRRGLPANHLVYGEGTAILAAIGLMNRAFAVAAGSAGLDAGQRLRIVDCLSWSIGTEGLVAGQEQDLHGLGAPVTAAGIEEMHGRKTGALFAAAAEIGAVVAGAGEETARRAREFGHRLGIAFQTFDDLVDRFASAGAALKDTGKDCDKPTLVALLGPDQAIAAAERELAAALRGVGGDSSPSALVRYVGELGDGLMARLDRLKVEAVDGAR